MSETTKKKSALAMRVSTGLILMTLLVAVLWLGGWYFAAVAFVCTGIAIYEELGALKNGGHNPVCWASYAALVLALPALKFFESSLAMMPILTVLSFGIVLHVMRREKPLLTDIMVSVLPMLTLVLPAMCLIGMAITDTMPHLRTMLLVSVFAIAVGGDTFAYFIGSALKGPKLCPNISPNKTISGSIGGLLGSVVCSIAVARLFALGGAQPYPPIWGDIIVGLLGGVAGQVGDLFASMVKRHCNVKDFGHIFPGHGGMLDRLDSIFFTCIIVYSYQVVVHTLLG